jgi:RNA polymerase sigma-70 factor (ECF subfamily)
LDNRKDEDIVTLIVEEKEHDLFGILYDRYKDKVYHKCLSFAKDSADAQDLLHDVFLKTFSSLSKFSGKSSFSTWLYSITYNYCVDYSRLKKKFPTKELDDTLEVNDKQDQANEEELFTLRAEQLKEVLDRIDPNGKAILLMKFQDEFSIKEIMSILDISESAVKMRIKRAKAQALEMHRTLYTEGTYE